MNKEDAGMWNRNGMIAFVQMELTFVRGIGMECLHGMGMECLPLCME